VGRLKALKGELEDYLAHFPAGIGVSDEIKEYATNEAMDFSKYIFIHREGRQQYGYSACCKKTFKTDGELRHNMEEIICPICQSKCKVKSAGMGRKKMIDEAYFVYYEKSIINPNVIVARGFYAVRDYRYDFTKVQTQIAAQALYVFVPGKSGQMFKRDWIGYRRDQNKIATGPFKKTSSVYSLIDYGHNIYIPNQYSRESILTAVRDTPFKYSTWDWYDIKDMTRFFDLYSKYPCIEYLSKLGMQNLVRDKLTGGQTYGTINWRGKTLFKVLRVGKQELNEIKKQKIYVTFDFLRTLLISKKNNWGLTLQEAKEMADNIGVYYLEQITVLSKYAPIKKIFTYIRNQCERNSRFCNIRGVFSDLRDYLEECRQLNMDLTDERILFPKNLHDAHQKTTSRIKLKNNKALDQQIKKLAIKLNEQFYFERQGLLIKPAGSFKELLTEGNKLSHCVANYAKSHATGSTTILFIRKADKPNKPFYTVEVARNQIIQVRGLNNCAPTDEVREFMQAFEAARLSKKTKVKISA
jgi:hypothetical protein